MNVAFEKRHLKFTDKNLTVYIDFALEFYPSPHEYKDRRTAYCTISVYDNNGVVKHYHAGTVYNPHDNYNQRTGMFIAFRKALRQRWEAIHEDVFKCYDENEALWEMYHKGWAHFLAAMMDGKVEDEQNTSNPF